MNGNEFRKKLKGGNKVFGTLITCTSPQWLEVVESTGLDFVFIDTEHIAIDRTTLSWMCHAYKSLDIATIVRIPMPDPYHACMALDGGADAIVAPYIEDVEEIKRLAGAVKYRPLKGKKLKDFLDGKIQLKQSLLQYLNKTNQGKSLIANIESIPAMNNLDQLLKVPGLDAVLIGPHDLSCSMEIPEAYFDDSFKNNVNQIIEKVRSHDISIGIHVFYGGIQDEVDWVKRGANLVMHSSDINLFHRMMAKEMDYLKQETGVSPGSDRGEIAI